MLAGSPGDAAIETLAAIDALQIRIVIATDLPSVVAGAAAGLVALCGRLFAHVTVEGDAALATNPWGATTVATVLDQIAWIRPSATRPPSTTISVGIGIDASDVDLSCGGGAFTVRLGLTPQLLDLVEIEQYGHAIGVHAAAALAAGQLLNRALTAVGKPAVLLAHDLVWNLGDYRLSPAAIHAPHTTRSPAVLFAGTGSVGTSAAAVLSMSPTITGAAVCVDQEAFDGKRNGFRYPALGAPLSCNKATWAADLLTAAGWKAVPFIGSISEWVIDEKEPGFDGLLVSSVDTIPARFDVVDVLARDTLSVGVAATALYAQRERLDDPYACPFCDFVATDPPLTQAHVIAQLVGFGDDIATVIGLQQPGATLIEAHVARAVAAGRIDSGKAADLVGRRLDDLVARTYAETVVTIPSTGGAVAVAAPHVAWMSGILAAAEVAKIAADLPALDRRLELDLIGLPQDFTTRVPKDTSGRCACASAHRIGWMRRLYGEPSD